MALDMQRVSRTTITVPSFTLRALPVVAAVLDALVMLAVILAASFMRRTWELFPAGADVSESLMVAGPLIVFAWLLVIYWRGGYSPSVFEVGTDELRRVGTATLATAGLVGAGCYLFHFALSRGFFFLAFMLGGPALIVGRLMLRLVVQQVRRHGSLQHHVLIAGSSRSVDEVADVLRREPRLGYQIVGALTPSRDTAEETATGIPVVGDVEQLTRSVIDSGADIIFLANGAIDSADDMRQLAYDLEHHDIQVVVAPSVSEVSSDRVRIRPVGGLPLLHIDPPRAVDAARWGKRLFDLVAASLILAAASPLLLCSAVQIRLHDGGPIFFRQVRTGRDGVEFSCLKLRTMVVDAEDRLTQLIEESGHTNGLFKLRQDPRVTSPGRWLRRYSIDELPQLLNVVRGDMSLVGPRPPLPTEVAQYSPRARRRLRVRPGLTGLWQISGRSDLPFDEAIRLDVYYVDNWSLLQDVSILLKTIGAVFGTRGAY